MTVYLPRFQWVWKRRSNSEAIRRKGSRFVDSPRSSGSTLAGRVCSDRSRTSWRSRYERYASAMPNRSVKQGERTNRRPHFESCTGHMYRGNGQRVPVVASVYRLINNSDCSISVLVGEEEEGLEAEGRDQNRAEGRNEATHPSIPRPLKSVVGDDPLS